MDRLSRRSFLGRALLAGAGATLFQPHEAIASGGVATLQGVSDPDYDPGFIAGKIIDSAKEVLTILDYDGQLRAARLTPASQTWKKGLWDILPPSVGDCTYVRGVPSPDGSVDVDRLWVDIVSIATEVLDAAASSFEIRMPNGDQAAVLVTPSTQVETPTGDWVIGTVESLKPGQDIQLIGFGDSQGGPLTATTVFVFSDSPAVDSGDATVDSTTFLRLGTWYCCHGQGACGSGSGSCLPGDGACGVCRSNRLQTAYPRLSTTNCEHCAGLACCLELPQRACGASASILNPCNNNSVNVRIQDCIGSAGTHSPVGCRNRSCRVLDLTPCAFSAIGSLDAGILNMNITL